MVVILEWMIERSRCDNPESSPSSDIRPRRTRDEKRERMKILGDTHADTSMT